mmetsp:Transcript_30230/g.48637  ORF Transcript_30230/g.48637 Transcript_30230/m.48637 type:complete len:211 (+) Transcript_30230:303-935(+)
MVGVARVQTHGEVRPCRRRRRPRRRPRHLGSLRSSEEHGGREVLRVLVEFLGGLHQVEVGETLLAGRRERGGVAGEVRVAPGEWLEVYANEDLAPASEAKQIHPQQRGVAEARGGGHGRCDAVGLVRGGAFGGGGGSGGALGVVLFGVASWVDHAVEDLRVDAGVDVREPDAARVRRGEHPCLRVGLVRACLHGQVVRDVNRRERTQRVL